MKLLTTGLSADPYICMNEEEDQNKRKKTRKMYEIVQSSILEIKELRCNQRRTTETKNDTFVIRSHLPGEPFDNSAE